MSSTVVRLRDNIFVSKAKINGAISSSLGGVVVSAPVSAIEVVVSFEPLNELKIVLILGFAKFLDLHIPFDSCFFECGLEDFEVVDEFVVVFGFPVDFVDGDFSRVYDIYDLAVDRAGSELLDFGDVELHR